MFYDSFDKLIIASGYNSNKRINYTNLLGLKLLSDKAFIDPYKNKAVYCFMTKYKSKSYMYTMICYRAEKTIGNIFLTLN